MLPYSVPDGATGEPHQKPTLRANHTYLDLGLVFEIQRYTAATNATLISRLHSSRCHSLTSPGDHSCALGDDGREGCLREEYGAQFTLVSRDDEGADVWCHRLRWVRKGECPCSK